MIDSPLPFSLKRVFCHESFMFHTLTQAFVSCYKVCLNGIGKLSLNAIANQDLPVMVGVTLFAAFFIVMMNLVVDEVYAFVDPRVRYS